MPDGQKESRLEYLKKSDSLLLKLPGVTNAEYIVDLFYKSGICLHGFSGAIPLSWSELKAFSDLSGWMLNEVESDVIMDMSKAYVASLSASKDVDAKAPFMTDEATEAIEKAKKIRSQIKNRTR
jgi:hypothetical protein